MPVVKAIQRLREEDPLSPGVRGCSALNTLLNNPVKKSQLK